MTRRRQQSHKFGLAAEKIAALYLRAKGYRILAERYRNAYGEIDIVAAKRGLLVAVEVKARKNIDDCAHTITMHKRQRLERAISGLLAGQRATSGKIAGHALPADPNIRFDVVWVAPYRLPRHIRDAWRLS